LRKGVNPIFGMSGVQVAANGNGQSRA